MKLAPLTGRRDGDRCKVRSVHTNMAHLGLADFQFSHGEMKRVHYQLIPAILKKNVTYPDGNSERVL